jgi:hypothetical protein
VNIEHRIFGTVFFSVLSFFVFWLISDQKSKDKKRDEKLCPSICPRFVRYRNRLKINANTLIY